MSNTEPNDSVTPTSGANESPQASSPHPAPPPVRMIVENRGKEQNGYFIEKRIITESKELPNKQNDSKSSNSKD